MTKFYPNDFDIYGFYPVELERVGRVTDRRTGILGRVVYMGGKACVKADGVTYEMEERV